MSSWTRSQQLRSLSITKEEFDNRILIIFLILMTVLIILGLFFVDFAKANFGANPPSSEDMLDSQNTKV